MPVSMILFRSPVFKSTMNSFRFWSERPRNCRLEIGPVGPDPNTAYQFPFVDRFPALIRTTAGPVVANPREEFENSQRTVGDSGLVTSIAKYEESPPPDTGDLTQSVHVAVLSLHAPPKRMPPIRIVDQWLASRAVALSPAPPILASN